MPTNTCLCGSNIQFQHCCEPYLQQKQWPQTAEQLMRSRFSAYATQQYQYILDTYAQSQRDTLSVKELQQSDKETTWLRLQIVNCPDDHTVEFKAYSKFQNQFNLLHEISIFTLENQHWMYKEGELLADTGQVKLNRNDQCLCGSGKKYKKCCI
ncbi:YchJ family protein [Aliiglaciecola lipolytica]|uniref:YchJ family protein n=1 Tax=Aliiglaciecola lipolytica TaxID=477689 RepID=UPI00129CB617|nr:YchJ family metal-binding protein [Aliiglaciecola lipolytica]